MLNDIEGPPAWCIESIRAVSAWMKEQGHESWVIAGVGPVPDKIILHGRGTKPNWFFIAERQSQTWHNNLPVYATLDPIQPAAPVDGEN